MVAKKVNDGKAKDEMMTRFEIPPQKLERMQVPIVGTTTLIMHNFGAKARQEMADVQGQAVKTKKRAPKDVRACFMDAFNVVRGCEKYHVGEEAPQGTYGIPVEAIRGAMIAACRLVDLPMTMAKISFRIVEPFVPITWDEIVMRQDFVRLASGVPDLRYRPEFHGWACAPTFEFDVAAISGQQLLVLLDRAGFGVGLLDWRPFSTKSAGGDHGRFRTGTQAEMKEIIDRLADGEKARSGKKKAS